MGEENGNGKVSSLAGLGKRNPLAAATMTIAMLSLAGIPPLSGFFAKYFLFNAALEENYTWLVLAAVAGTLISVYYYFRVIHSMYIAKGSEDKMSNSAVQTIVMVVLAAMMLLLGMMPDLLLRNIGA
jgi:NADH-quinone oxidoreductase subunit N